MSSELPEVLDHAPCGFVSFGDDGVIHQINATLLTRLDYSRDEVVGGHFEKLLGTGARIFYQTHFFPLVKLHGRAQEIFILLRSRNGDDVGMLCNASRRERSGEGVTDCILMEVIERRKFEEALVEARQNAERFAEQLESQALELELQHQQLQEQAEELEVQSETLQNVNDELVTLNADLKKQRAAADEANHAKSNFLAVMSHELRTPLNAIGGYVQLLEMGVHGPIGDAQKETLGRIDRSQRHLLRLINDVLNLSRIEAGRVDYAVEPVVLSDLVQNVLPMCEPQALSKNISIESVVPRKLVATADREKVQQILLNLLTNAIKFTRRDGNICVEGQIVSDSTVSLRVIDNGVGIPPEMIEKVFEPFVQVDASRSRSAEGTGLGLAISRDLARGMGGDLTLSSKVGHGSTFELSLPRAGNG
ncbi:MAG TPA: PAS domain-containing sensor histidine kinase [Gemmatimonadaceae bacterium]